MVFLRCIGTLLRHDRFLLHGFCDCGLIIAQTGVGCFGIRFCLGERRIKKCLKTGALKFGCGKSGTATVENAWKTASRVRDFPHIFLMCSILVPMNEEKIRKSFFGHGKLCGKCYKTMYFRAITHLSTARKRAKLENITYLKSIFSVDFIQ